MKRRSESDVSVLPLSASKVVLNDLQPFVGFLDRPLEHLNLGRLHGHGLQQGTVGKLHAVEWTSLLQHAGAHGPALAGIPAVSDKAQRGQLSLQGGEFAAGVVAAGVVHENHLVGTAVEHGCDLTR